MISQIRNLYFISSFQLFLFLFIDYLNFMSLFFQLNPPIFFPSSNLASTRNTFLSLLPERFLKHPLILKHPIIIPNQIPILIPKGPILPKNLLNFPLILCLPLSGHPISFPQLLIESSNLSLKFLTFCFYLLNFDKMFLFNLFYFSLIFLCYSTQFLY